MRIAFHRFTITSFAFRFCGRNSIEGTSHRVHAITTRRNVIECAFRASITIGYALCKFSVDTVRHDTLSPSSLSLTFPRLRHLLVHYARARIYSDQRGNAFRVEAARVRKWRLSCPGSGRIVSSSIGCTSIR